MPGTTLNALVADDSESIHAFFQMIAARSPVPFRIVSACDGADCARLLRQNGIDIAFVDINMPEMNGLEALGKARLSGYKSFVTLMSSDLQPHLRRKALLFNVYGFLRKPFTEAQVHGILNTCLRIRTPIKALIADPSPMVRQAIRHFIAKSIFNIELTEVEDAAETLFSVANHRYDAILVDCNMPGLDGLKTLGRIKRCDPNAKIIMMTNDRSQAWHRLAVEHGAMSLLCKPFNAEEIDRTIHAFYQIERPGLDNLPGNSNPNFRYLAKAT
jgi:DNA-binding NarL/FixJ family response regulator